MFEQSASEGLEICHSVWNFREYQPFFEKLWHNAPLYGLAAKYSLLR
ncbi:hypothetical protein [Alteromonas stellipolaris]|nr:hypothetical protein [Alteromonas stellipolaris]MBZ2163786.1 hypothetical protein [Alteromonas stellipolaris]